MAEETMTGRELDWNDEIQDDGQDFEPVPAGDYNVTIERFERSRSKGEGKLPACNMAVVYFTVHAPERDVTVRENYILHTSVEWKLSELFCSVGLKKKGEPLRMDWQALPGKTARAKIGLYPGRKNPDRKYNQIDTLYPKEENDTPHFTLGSF